jgi:hypothetical protein
MSFGIATGAFVAERDDRPRAIAGARAGSWPFLELTAIDMCAHGPWILETELAETASAIIGP